jgi:RHS repeat-associated protein
MTAFEFLTKGDSLIFAYDLLGNCIMKTYFQDSLQTYTALNKVPDSANAFGMVMPERSFSNDKYRYGFNGKENDNEVKGAGNSIDFGARIHDPRLGRLLSIDPLSKKFPSESNYSYAGNSPILFIDEEGKKKTIYLTIIDKNGSKTTVQVVNKYEVIQKTTYTQQSIGIPGVTIYTGTNSETKTYDIEQSVIVNEQTGITTLGDERLSKQRSNSALVRGIEVVLS